MGGAEVPGTAARRIRRSRSGRERAGSLPPGDLPHAPREGDRPRSARGHQARARHVARVPADEALPRDAPSAELLAERNLGRGSIAEARALIEPLIGAKWESFVPAKEQAAPAESFSEVARAGKWDALRGLLDDSQRATLIADIELPARVRTYVANESVATLGDLASRSAAVLGSAGNLGRASIGELARAIGEHFDRVARDSELMLQGLLEGFRALVQREEPMLRIILKRRSGLAGDPETLQALGETFGVTRERIRQLEARAVGALARRPWGREVAKRVAAAIAEGPVPVETLASGAWWAGVAERTEVLRFVCETMLDGAAYVIDWDDEIWLSPAKVTVVQRAWSELLDKARRLELPAPIESLAPFVDATRAKVGAALGARLEQRLRTHLQIIDDRVVAIGETRRAEAVAILRSADGPMHTDELFRRLGTRVHLPEEVIHFGRGLVGLDQHIPDFARWRERVAPAARDVMTRLGPDRQWSCDELLEELREEIDFPEWFTAWHLGAIARRTDSLAYLGRLRVSLPQAAEADGRVFIHEAAERILRQAGAPVGRDELLAKIRAQVGASEFTLNTLFARPQFVRTDADAIGLLDRDVPGGAAAIADAIEHVEGVLERRGRGLSSFHVHQEVRGLSASHEQWTEELTFSLLRSDGRFRTSQHGAVGLASWESTRVPTRLELARAALEEGEGRVSVEAISARIEAHFGRAPTRATLAGIALHLGAALDGERIVRRSGA